jgi:hypothetical protein
LNATSYTRVIALLPVFLLVGVMGMVVPAWAQDAPAVVGRVFDVEKDLLRYVPEENDWVAVVKDAPFAPGDTLFSGSQGRAELLVPNGTSVRIGNSTQIQFTALGPDVTETDVAGGVSRFYNKGPHAVIKVTSPFGYILSYPGAIFDLYAGENSLEVVAVKGKVSFVHSVSNARYDVSAGSPSLLVDRNQVASGEIGSDPNWDAWNRARDKFWVAKAMARVRSWQYLPPVLRDDAYVLDENGRWEPVYYEGSERWFWRPTTVAPGWAPFTAGRWTEWEGDQTWMPAEPFGYVTHHYGNWVLIGARWYWAPPVAGVVAGRPVLDVGFAWCPGRVAWIHHGSYVGWVPLAPYETYYSHHHWGGSHTVAVTDAGIGRITLDVSRYAYADHAVVVSRNNFYGVNDYRNVRITNINSTTIINTYHTAPVVDNTVVDNYTAMKQRYNYSNVTINEKPHISVVNQIQRNRDIVARAGRESATTLQQQVKTARFGKINHEARIPQPTTRNYVVPAAQASRPISQIQWQQREVKGTAGTRQVQSGHASRSGPQPPQSPPIQHAPRMASPAKPPQPQPGGPKGSAQPAQGKKAQGEHKEQEETRP